jgi:hypothetical protein
MTLTKSHHIFSTKCGYVHILGVVPDSRTKSPQELIRESNLKKTSIAAPIRCSPRLPYQISRIDSGVKFHSYP